MSASTENGSQQQCALVTGSSNGIGEAIVLELAALDYKLVVTGRNGADVSRVAALCADRSPSKSKPLEIVADLADELEVRRLFDGARKHFNGRLDLLVNNAGLGAPVSRAQVDECWSSFKCTMQVNLMSAVQLTLLSAPLLEQTARASAQVAPTTTCSVINIGSLAALRTTQSLAAYGTSKCALNFFTQCMAVELGPYVRVNCVNPGPVATKIIERAGFDLGKMRDACAQVAPLRRLASADEVAHAVLFLADPKRAGFITGASLSVDGGCALIPVRWSPPSVAGATE